MKLAAAYVRVSTEEQAMRGYSIEAQRDAIRKYARENGYKIVAEYSEAGVIIGLNTARPLRHIGLRCFGSVFQLFDVYTLSRETGMASPSENSRPLNKSMRKFYFSKSFLGGKFSGHCDNILGAFPSILFFPILKICAKYYFEKSEGGVF